MKTLNTILEEANYKAGYSNNSFYYRSVNTALATGMIKLDIVPNGFARTNQETGFKYNFTVSAKGKTIKCYTNGMYPDTILEQVAKLISNPKINERLRLDAEGSEKCGKCAGKGIIPAFMHICKGVCFECLGIGYKFKK